MDNIEKISIFIDAIKDEDSSTGFLFRNLDRTLGEFPEKDFIIPISLERVDEAIGYVSVSSDKTISSLERQEFNPYFIEFDFFTTISRNRILSSDQLSTDHISFIRENRLDIDIDFPTDDGIKNWFDEFGLNELPWNPGTSNEVTIDTLDKIKLNLQTIVSKASIYPIEINS